MYLSARLAALQLLREQGVLLLPRRELSAHVIGLSGVISYTVAQRTREIGIRLAIGARPLQVLWMIEKQALLLVCAGIAGGLVGSVIVSRSLANLLFNVSPTDPLTFIVIAAVFLVTALLSGLVPARRAASIDPAITLRAE